MNPRVEIIATIKRFDDVKLNEEALTAMAKLDLTRGLEAISWLLKHQLIYHHKGKYHVTALGDEYIQQTGLYTERRTSLKAWKEEALLGIVETRSKVTHGYVTRQSTMDRAVLSTASMEAPEGIRADQMLIELERIIELRKILCSDLGVTLSEYEKLNNEGRIRICRHGASHVGIFDKKTGKYFHSRCRKCRKRNRQESRS